MRTHSGSARNLARTMRARAAICLTGLAAMVCLGRAASAQQVEFKIVKRSSFDAVSPINHTVDLAVQAKVTGKGLGQFIFSPMITGEADANGNLYLGRITALDGTYYTGPFETLASVGQGGLAGQYSGLAALNAWLNGRVNVGVPGFANTTGNQEINGISGAAMTVGLLNVPGVDDNDDGVPDTASGTTATLPGAIMANYFAKDQFIDVYRFRYKATNWDAARTLHFGFQSGIWAEVFDNLKYSVGTWKADTLGLIENVPVTELNVPLRTFDYGDVNHDLNVNCADAIAAASAWGRTSADPAYKVELDYNNDGDNDATDKGLFDTAYTANCSQTAPACGPGWISGMGLPTPAPTLVRAATRWAPLWANNGELVAKQLVIAYDYLDGANTRGAIARWDGATWTVLASGIVGTVDALTVNPLPTSFDTVSVYGNKLVAGGSFASIGGVSANNIAYFDGANWRPYHDPTGSGPAGGGVGGSGTVNVKALYTFGNLLYAGGNFTSADEVSVSNLALWDGSAWNDVGGGTNSPVTALGDFGGRLYVGGSSSLTSVGGSTSVAGIASWDGTDWYSLGSGISNGQVNCVVKFGTTGLAVGGSFTLAGGASNTSRIALWNGSGWSSLGSGLNGTVHCLATASSTSGLTLVAGGEFAASGSTPMLRVARWRSSAWESLGTGLAGVSSNVRSVVQIQGLEIIPCGVFSIAGSSTVQNLARWSESGKPWIAIQPAQGASAAINGSVTMSTTIASGYIPPATLQWEKSISGTYTAITGETSSSLHISSVQQSSYGAYRLKATISGCGDAVSGVFYLAQGCPADQNNDGVVTVQDIFDFLDDWFDGCIGSPPIGIDPMDPCSDTADANLSGTLEVQDIFDFLNAWFAGCPLP